MRLSFLVALGFVWSCECQRLRKKKLPTLERDPIGEIPFEDIKEAGITSSAGLFRAASIEAIPAAEFGEQERLDYVGRFVVCRRKLVAAAKTFANAYADKRGSAVYTPVRASLKSKPLESCRKLPTVAANLQQSSLAALRSPLRWAVRDLGLNDTAAYINFLNILVYAKTNGQIRDFGRHLMKDADALCVRLANAEAGTSFCGAMVEDMCIAASNLRDSAKAKDLKTRAAVRDFVEFDLKIPGRLVRRQPFQSAPNTCFCMGTTLRASTQKEGRVPSCLKRSAAMVYLRARERPQLSLFEAFLLSQKTDQPVSYAPLFKPSSLNIVNSYEEEESYDDQDDYDDDSWY